MSSGHKHIDKGPDLNIIIPLDFCGNAQKKSLVLGNKAVDLDPDPHSRLQHFLAVATWSKLLTLSKMRK